MVVEKGGCNIPPTSPSFAGDPNVPLMVDSSSLPLTSTEIFIHLIAVDATDNSSLSEESCDQMPIVVFTLLFSDAEASP